MKLRKTLTWFWLFTMIVQAIVFAHRTNLLEGSILFVAVAGFIRSVCKLKGLAVIAIIGFALSANAQVNVTNTTPNSSCPLALTNIPADKRLTNGVAGLAQINGPGISVNWIAPSNKMVQVQYSYDALNWYAWITTSLTNDTRYMVAFGTCEKQLFLRMMTN